MKKILSLLLALALMVALLGTSALSVPASAADDEKDSGMKISKTATYNAETDDYTITLEAYATGQKVISEIKKDIPTDIVLVIDQSGSMAHNIAGTSYTAYSGNDTKNSNLYSKRHNGGSGNLWVKVGDDYLSVSVTVQETVGYSQLSASTSHDTYKSYEQNLYASVNGEYQQVSIVETGSTFAGANKYQYQLPDGTVIATASRGFMSTTWTLSDISGVDGNVLYQRTIDSSKSVYTYTYTANNTTTTIGTSTGYDATFTSTTLYSKSTGSTEPRLDALMRAAKSFAENVNKKAKGADGIYDTEDDVNHRIAVVGFASDTNNYKNTELLTGVTIQTGIQNYGTSANTSNNRYYPTGYAKNGAQYGSITPAQYQKAFQDMDTTAGYGNVTTALDALTAYGGTQTNHGIDMANEIFKNNPIPAGEQRQRIVIVFTDGIPTGNGSNYDSSVANSAIANAKTAKETYGATVYAIGIFDGADATKAGSTGYNSSDADKGNYVCQQISSNNGTPQSPSYYLSAGDSSALNNIFQQIADQIEEGGSSTELDEQTVIRDIIAPQFQLPNGATKDDITIETWRCTGRNGSEYTWSKNDTVLGATATVDGDKVNVTGFNFSENWVGTDTNNGNTTYRGNKLVIKFTVKAKDGFLGGNDVYTNTSAGVYENSTATDPVLTFPRPQVNVPIKGVTVEAEDKNVYLLAGLTAEQIKSGFSVSVGEGENAVSLDLSKENLKDNNFGLEPWQYEYVTIKVKYTDEQDKKITITDLNGLEDDKTYKVSVSIIPTPATENHENEAQTVTRNGELKINVFKPELTFIDSEVWYGGTAPTDPTDYNDNNYDTTVWKHGETPSTSVDMIDTAPTLNLTYTPESSKIENGKINSKQNIAVDVTVEIDGTKVNEYTFVHTKCGANESDPSNGKFWLHVNTCQLTITKTGGAKDESYVFDVYKDGEKYTEVTIWGNGSETIYELPVGTYTILENTGWSWRYTANNGSAATLSAQTVSGNITCTNTSPTDKWLNGFSTIVRNIYGVPKSN